MCSKHAQRMRRHGDPLYVRTPKMEQECSIPGCDRKVGRAGARGWCPMHYQRWQKHGDPEYERETVTGVADCSIDSCGNKVAARGWCMNHYVLWRKHGSPTPRRAGEVVDGMRICPACEQEKPLSEWNASQPSCRECQKKRFREWYEKSYVPAPKSLGKCLHCKKTFIKPKKSYKHCSPECSKASRSQRKWKHSVIRTERIKAVTVEPFCKLDVFERDGWVCGICHDPIDRNRKFPDPMCATVDHIVPVSRGGEHSMENTQAAHFTCNMKKGDRVPM